MPSPDSEVLTDLGHSVTWSGQNVPNVSAPNETVPAIPRHRMIASSIKRLKSLRKLDLPEMLEMC